ncbi:MAG TPA: type I restriction endonuclease [Fimbriimonadaceae bacterium]|nr:type I restriction endonuclease [Fimbriimonadaceae bacterium]
MLQPDPVLKNTVRSFNVDPHALLVDCDIVARGIFRETAYRCLVEIGAAPTEEDLRAKVVVPVLQALGYRNYDIHLEEYLPHSGRADAVAYINDVPVIAVECKRPGTLAKGHAVRDALTQAERYAIEIQVGRVLITDGDVWLLTDGRSEVLTIPNRWDFLRELERFFTWLRPSSMWIKACGLRYPDGLWIGAVLDRIQGGNSALTDLEKVAAIRGSEPRIAEVLDRLILNVIAIRNDVKLLEKAKPSGGDAIIRCDRTLIGSAPSSWDYDPLYHFLQMAELAATESFLDRPDASRGTRILVVEPKPKATTAARAHSVAKRLLDNRWVIGVMSYDLLAEYGLSGFDVVENYVVDAGPELPRASFAPRRARLARLSLDRLIGDHPSHFVLPGRPDTRTRLARLAERTIRQCPA